MKLIELKESVKSMGIDVPSTVKLRISEYNSGDKEYITLDDLELKEVPPGLPKKIRGSLYLGSNKLTSLAGSPDEVAVEFFVHRNPLKSLEGGPAVVGDDYSCHNCALTSLKGAPKVIGGSLNCTENQISTLEGFPEVINASMGKGNTLDCWNNRLTSLKDINKHIKEINGEADFSKNPIESHVLGLLKIKGLTRVGLDNVKVKKIINRHLAGDRDLLACQEELMDAGLEEYAQL